MVHNAGGWVLQVDGKPFFIKGMAYLPDKVGETPNNATLRDWMISDDNGNGHIDSPYDSFVDSNGNNVQDSNEPTVGDFQLMKNMGVNTIRVYHHASDAPEVQAGYGGSPGTLLQYNHPPNKTLLRDLYNTYGIRVAMGDYLGAYTIGSGASWSSGTDYTDATQKDRMKASVRQMVLDFKDEPFLLMYVIGNENTYSWTQTNAYSHPVQYAQFVEEVVQMIHSLDPNHPVSICQGDVDFLSTIAQYAPSVDIYGANVYRGANFGNFWQQIQTTYGKPALILEYGNIHPLVGGVMDEAAQQATHLSNWQDIASNGYLGSGYGNAIGGVAFSWMDKWWPVGSASVHDVSDEEWLGSAAQGDQLAVR